MIAPDIRAPWFNRDFLLHISTRGSFVIARQMLAVAVGWDVYIRTGDLVALGIVGLCTFFPTLLFSILAGVAADRFDRRLILALALAAQAAAAVWIGLWFAWGGAGMWPVYAAMTLVGTAHAFFNPALNSSLPRLVPPEVFSNAAATSSSISKIGHLVGPIGGGLLLSAGGRVAKTRPVLEGGGRAGVLATAGGGSKLSISGPQSKGKLRPRINGRGTRGRARHSAARAGNANAPA
jgi:MFS family permease